MKKRIFLIGIAGICFVFFNGSMAWAGGWIGKRQVRQHARIGQGLRCGEITGKEYTRLTREQARIQKTKRRALRDDRLDRGERRRLHHMQNRAHRHIYSAKHHPRQDWRKPSAWDRHHHKGPKKSCAPCYKPLPRRSYRPARVVNHLSGLIAEPEWLFAWSVGF